MTDPESKSAAATTVAEHAALLGDDTVPSEEGLPGDGESITGETSSATATAPTERED